jgi:hypothetical protein
LEETSSSLPVLSESSPDFRYYSTAVIYRDLVHLTAILSTLESLSKERWAVIDHSEHQKYPRMGSRKGLLNLSEPYVLRRDMHCIQTSSQEALWRGGVVEKKKFGSP